MRGTGAEGRGLCSVEHQRNKQEKAKPLKGTVLYLPTHIAPSPREFILMAN